MYNKLDPINSSLVVFITFRYCKLEQHMTENILFVCGSLNQTRMMHKISRFLSDSYRCFFTPFYADGLVRRLAKLGLLHSTILGGQHQQATCDYLQEQKLATDWRGEYFDYGLVVTGTDLIVQKNIRDKRLILVQEGITTRESFIYYLVKWLKLPRYLANTSATGLSDQYDIFCVASRGYRDLFIKKGVKPEKIIVTGIPNFDHIQKLEDHEFPYEHYVLAATSPMRESFLFDNRKEFLKKCYQIANGRNLIFKLHPSEKEKRARREIQKYCPGLVVLTDGNVDVMIANTDVVITQESSCSFTAVALGKELHSYLDVEKLRRLLPLQNRGTSAKRIAKICQNVLDTLLSVLRQVRAGFRARPKWEKLD